MNFKKITSSIIFYILLSCTVCFASQIQKEVGNRKYIKKDSTWYLNTNGYLEKVVPGRILVRFKETTSESQISNFNAEIGTSILRIHRNGLYIITLKNNEINPIDIVEKYYDSGLVEYADPNIAMKVCESPNDYYYDNDYQLSLNDPSNIHDIDVPQAWDIETGDSSVLVAVIDTGVDIDHPDLIDNMSSYNDDFYGNYNNNVGQWRNHGTFVAGIIAASTHNYRGVAGIAGGWDGNGVQIMALACGSSQDLVNRVAVVAALEYAIEYGADVINCSWGSPSYYAPYEDLIEECYENHIVVVAATGNDSTFVGYPASYPHVIGVGASYGNVRAFYSNHSYSLDVVAPSGDACPPDLFTSPVYSTKDGGGYDPFTGTSAAAPQVAGLAALLLSYDPSLSVEDITEIICKSADKFSNYSFDDNQYGHDYGAWNHDLGYGRINAFKALLRLQGSGTVTTDITWHNDIEISNNLTIASGVTLTVDDGVTVSMTTNKKIDVNGTLVLNDGSNLLHVDGEDSDYHWGFLDINSTGTLNISDGVTIDGSTAVVIYGSASFPTGNNSCTISNGIIGLIANYSSPTIRNTYFTDNDYSAIRSFGSNSVIVENITVTGSEYGVDMYGSSDMSIDESVFVGNENCIYLDSYYCGMDINGGLNDLIPDTGFAIESSGICYVEAHGNFWGYSNPTPYLDDLFSHPCYISWWFYADEAFESGAPTQKMAIQEKRENPREDARKLEKKGDWRGAIDKYNDIIETENDEYARRFSIKRILQLNKENNLAYGDIRETISKQLEKADSWYMASLDFLMCETYVCEGKIDEAISAYNKNVSKYSGTSMEVVSLCRLATIHADYKLDQPKALEMANKAAALNPGQRILSSAFHSADVKYDPSLHFDKFEGLTENFDDLPGSKEKPAEDAGVEFFSPSPNPFNPATTLSYSLANPGHVNLEVFSVSGQKVVTLVDSHMSAGEHSAVFDGKGLASGIYFYRFESEGVHKTGRMTLVK
ncbi:S8 family serine peptidase [Candidatus Latescibacterota bacterium]